MNFRRLKYFVKIVDIGSLTRAAEVLHIAQPALSQQVATLEGELNQQLLIRTKRALRQQTPEKFSIPMRGPFYVSVNRPNWRCITLVRHYRGKSRLALHRGTAASSITMPLLQAVRAEFPEIVIYLHENSGAVLNEN